MRVAVAYHKGDIDQARRLAERMAEFGPYRGHSLLIGRDISTDENPFHAVGFEEVKEIVIANDAWKKWPESPNNAFRTLAKWIEYKEPLSWLWLEPDVVIVEAGWLDKIAAEYAKGGKPFMGDRVPGAMSGSTKVPDHMSGVGVYPGQLTHHAGKAVTAMEIPWDVEAADQILPRAHITTLIQHNWRPPEFDSFEAVARELRPSAVLYHKDKTGKLQARLRAKEQGITLAPEPADLPPILPKRETLKVEGIEAAPAKRWGNQLDAVERVKVLAGELKTYCDSPMHTAHVREILKTAGVIMVVKPRKRRRKAEPPLPGAKRRGRPPKVR